MNTAPAVELRSIRKTFGKCVANADVSVRIDRGTIHAVVGENGAGKSTIMKILFGLYKPDQGEIWVEGKKRHWQSAKDASGAGIGMVHQHFMLSHVHSVLDNIILGVEPSAKNFARVPSLLRPINRQEARAKLTSLMERFGMSLDLDAPAGSLQVGLQQRIEILKVLFRDARILILDEPTAVLTPQETRDFLANLRRMKTEGNTIIIITHKLREVLACADRITIMRQGRVISEVPALGMTEEKLAELMVGRAVKLHGAAGEERKVNIKSDVPLLAVENFSLSSRHKRQLLADINLTVQSGEIVGIAGVDGNGQHELLELLSHPQSFTASSRFYYSGRILVRGKVAHHADNRHLRCAGLGFIPADRLKDGILSHQSMFFNFILGHHFRSLWNRLGMIKWKSGRRRALDQMTAFDVRPLDLDLPAGQLSGGNQQKLVFAREFQSNPEIIIAANPTRGVDVGAIEFLHGKLLDARRRGCAVLLVSSELSEVMGLSDRLLVLYRGAIAGSFVRGEYDENKIGILMGGGKT